MSPLCENFIRAVITQNWKDAFLNLNGLNMFEMLRGLAALDRLDLTDLSAQKNSFAGMVNMPRIEYALEIVVHRRVPQNAPGDLQATGQVGDARSFIGNPTPLVFENDLTGLLPDALANPPTITEVDFITAAHQIRAEVAGVMSVAQVEAGGRAGFGPDGRPIIRYELHIFDGRTGGIYRHTHPHLSQPTLQAGNRFHNGTQTAEWSLMQGAMILREPGGARRSSDAWQSASWGMFQVMGFNFSKIGWQTIDDFVADMFASEGQQLSAFLGFVRRGNLGRHIASHDWAAFARGYNGAGFAVNHYDQHMAAAFARISTQRQHRHLPP